MKHRQASWSPLTIGHRQDEEKERNITFFVSDVGMNNSQRSGPGNGFFFFQDLQQESQSCHGGRGWGNPEGTRQAATLWCGSERASNEVMDVRC